MSKMSSPLTPGDRAHAETWLRAHIKNRDHWIAHGRAAPNVSVSAFDRTYSELRIAYWTAVLLSDGAAS
jgi:hypothetical protein